MFLAYIQYVNIITDQSVYYFQVITLGFKIRFKTILLTCTMTKLNLKIFML